MIPPLDPAGILAAVVSATLFTAAIVYVVRSKVTVIEAPLTEVLAGDSALRERDLFANVMLERHFSWRGFLFSAALHLWVILGTPLVPYLFPEKLNFNLRRYNVRIVEFRVPQALLYTPEDRGAKKSAPRRSPPARADQAAGRPGAKDARTLRAAAVSKRPVLQLPVPRVKTGKDVVIQPDQAPDLAVALQKDLPTAFLWAQRPAPLDLSLLVGAPERLPIRTFSLPRSQPKIQRPNRELAVSDLQIGAAPVLTFRPPQLPVLVGNVSPIRVPSPPVEAPSELPASALSVGTPANLIALMQTPAPLAVGYLVDIGNRLGDAQALGPAQPTAGAQSGSSGAGQQEVANNTGSAASTPALEKGTHADLLKAAEGEGNGTAPSGAEKAVDETAAKPATHTYPTGHLGVIIIQQSSQETMLEGGDALTGQPVHTVYFDVPGAPRRWVLQYCVPGSTSASSIVSSEGVIRILPKKSVQPPYPLDRIPVDLKGFRGDAHRLVVYATVNERGETENVRLVRGTGHEVDGEAVATLKRWAFRPAMRGDTPVAVEALFGIPLQ